MAPIGIFSGQNVESFQYGQALFMPSHFCQGLCIIQAEDMASGDINNDGLMDFIACADTGSVVVALGDGKGGFTATVFSGFGGNSRGTDLADFNGDGTLDMVRARYGDGHIYVYPGNGDGTFGSGIFVVALAANKELFPKEITGTAVGLLNMLPFSGAAIFPPLMGYVMDRVGRVAGAYPVNAYRQAFILCFILAGIAFLSICAMKETLHRRGKEEIPT